MRIKEIIKEILEMRYDITNFISLKHYSVKYGANLQIRGRLMIWGPNITIGNNVRIKSGSRYNPIGGDDRTILVCNKNASITIGDNVGISNSTIVAHQKVVIGNNVLLGGSVKVYDTDFHSLTYEKRMSGFEDVHTAPVCIEDGAFIGAHSIILKDVTIGEKSIVGAGSVVTRNIPPHEIWAGNPAKFIRKLEE